MRKKKNLQNSDKPTNVEPNVLAIPGLFVRGANSKGIEDDTRTVRQTRNEGGLLIHDEVVISRTSHGFPTVNDLSLLFFLFDLYEQQGYPEKIEVSLRSMAEFLGKAWGGNNRQMVLNCLDRLGSTSFLWKSVFKAATDTSSSRERFTLLSYWHQEKAQLFSDDQDRTYLEKTFVRLAPQISNNLRVGFSIPIDLQTFKNLKIDLSKQIYSWACSRLILEPDEIEKSCRVSSLQLFEELSIGGTRYSKKSKRKEVLLLSVKEVNKKKVPQGFMLATLHDTDIDVELVLTIQRPASPVPPQNTITAYELVELFLKTFDRKSRNPTQLELDSAADFLRSYPIQPQQAESFLRTIFSEVRKVGYSPEWFSGIRRNLIELAQKSFPPETVLAEPTPAAKKTRPRQTRKQPVFPALEGIVPVTDILSEHELDESRIELGKSLFEDLGENDQKTLLEDKIQELMNSDNRKTYKRWSTDQVEEHAKMLIFRRLGEAGNA